MSTHHTAQVLVDVKRERLIQDRRFGLQNHPDGTGPEYAGVAEQLRTAAAYAQLTGALTWRHVLSEEVYEALSETDPKLLRAELVQVAAVATAWVEALDRRSVSR